MLSCLNFNQRQLFHACVNHIIQMAAAILKSFKRQCSTISFLNVLSPCLIKIKDPYYMTPQIKSMLRKKNKLLRKGRIEDADALTKRISQSISVQCRCTLTIVLAKEAKLCGTKCLGRSLCAASPLDPLLLSNRIITLHLSLLTLVINNH